jgi:hypothetical protein
MAISRFVTTANVTLAADVLTAGTGGWGNATGANAAGAYNTCGPQVIPANTVIIADSSAGSTGPQLLYQAIGASNLRAYIPGQDDVGHAALAN